MDPAHEMAAETETRSPGAVPGFDHELDEHPALEDFQRLLATDSQTKSAPESQAKRRVSFGRYLVAICIGVAGTLAWQSYSEATKQTTATTTPRLGWSPEAKLASWVQQLEWTKPPATLEYAAVWSSLPETPQLADPVASKTAALDDAAQRQQIALSLAALRQTVQQIAAGQDKTAREINKLAADVEMLSKVPAHPPQPPIAPARKPMPTPLTPLSRAPPH